MKKIVGLVLLLALVGCSQNTLDNTDTGLGIAQTVANTAGAAGVPFAGAVATALCFAITTMRGIRKTGTEKQKKEALYQSTADIHKKSKYLAKRIEDGTITLPDLLHILPTMVKDVSTVSHSAYGVYEKIEQDLDKLHAKGKLKKLS